MAFCKNCGVQLNEGDMFCSRCGTSINGTNTQASITIAVDSKKIQDGLLRIKNAIIKLVKNPFKGVSEAHEILNPFASYLFAVLLALSYGLTSLWTRKAIMDEVKKSISSLGILENLGSIVALPFKNNSGKTFQLTFFTVLLSIVIIFGLLYLVSNVMLKQNQKNTTLLNAAVFPLAIFLVIGLIENIVIYISLNFYLALVAISIIFLVVYLYHNISFVFKHNNENSVAAYVSALSFACITIIYNIVILDNLLEGFAKNIQDVFRNLM